MTKKKTAKKKTVKQVKVEVKRFEDSIDSQAVLSQPTTTCSTCNYFRINGEGAKRGRCHRYPSSTPTEINHFCGEFK